MILYTLNDRTRSLGLFPFALSLGLSQAPFLKPKAIGLVFIRRKEQKEKAQASRRISLSLQAKMPSFH